MLQPPEAETTPHPRRLPAATACASWASRFNRARFDDVLQRVESFVAGAAPRRIVTVNLDYLRLAHPDASFRETLNGADLAIADGMPWSGPPVSAAKACPSASPARTSSTRSAVSAASAVGPSSSWARLPASQPRRLTSWRTATGLRNVGHLLTAARQLRRHRGAAHPRSDPRRQAGRALRSAGCAATGPLDRSQRASPERAGINRRWLLLRRRRGRCLAGAALDAAHRPGAETHADCCRSPAPCGSATYCATCRPSSG